MKKNQQINFAGNYNYLRSRRFGNITTKHIIELADETEKKNKVLK